MFYGLNSLNLAKSALTLIVIAFAAHICIVAYLKQEPM